MITFRQALEDKNFPNREVSFRGKLSGKISHNWLRISRKLWNNSGIRYGSYELLDFTVVLIQENNYSGFICAVVDGDRFVAYWNSSSGIITVVWSSDIDRNFIETMIAISVSARDDVYL